MNKVILVRTIVVFLIGFFSVSFFLGNSIIFNLTKRMIFSECFQGYDAEASFLDSDKFSKLKESGQHLNYCICISDNVPFEYSDVFFNRITLGMTNPMRRILGMNEKEQEDLSLMCLKEPVDKTAIR
jgi:hypothetical protein